jgi:NAD+--asparagine ADP-ribosyltransferase
MTPEEKLAARAAYMRQWNARNPDKVRASSKKKYWKNRTKSLEIARRYRSDPKNAQAANERAKQWQQEHRERRKAYMEKYYAANREKFLKKTRDWNSENPAKRRAHGVEYNARRQNRLKGVSEKDKLACRRLVEREARKRVHRCYYCQKRFRGEVHFDHVVALARGGRHEPSNLAVSCPACNSSKQDKPVGSLQVNGQKLLNV